MYQQFFYLSVGISIIVTTVISIVLCIIAYRKNMPRVRRFERQMERMSESISELEMNYSRQRPNKCRGRLARLRRRLVRLRRRLVRVEEKFNKEHFENNTLKTVIAEQESTVQAALRQKQLDSEAITGLRNEKEYLQKIVDAMTKELQTLKQ